MSQMARVWIREQGLTIPVTEDLPEAFANGYRFAQIMHRLGGISDDTFSRFRDKSTPAAILSNFSLLVSWLCRAFHLQVSQRTVNDIIAKRPNAAVRLLKRIRKASHASHSQVPRTSSSTTDSAGDDEADARERLLVTATLDKGVPVTDNVLLMRRFYEAQLAQERAFDRDQDEQLRRKRDAFLERYRAEQEHMHQRKVDRQTGAIASSQQAKVNRDRIFANERRELELELFVRGKRDRRRQALHSRAVHDMRDGLAEFDNILQLRSSVTEVPDDDDDARAPSAVPVPAPEDAATVLEFIERLAVKLPDPQATANESETIMKQLRARAQADRAARAERARRRRAALEKAVEGDESLEAVASANGDAELGPVEVDVDGLEKAWERRRLKDGFDADDRLAAHRAWREAFQRMCDEVDAASADERTALQNELLERARRSREHVQDQARRSHMAFCTGIVSRLVAASVRIAGHRQASPGALVDRDAFLRWFHAVQNDDHGGKVSVATPTVEPDTDLFANDPDPTAHDNAVSSYLSSSTTTGTLQGSPYLDEVRSVVGAGRPRPASRAPLVPVKLALIAAGDATLPAPLSSSFLLDHVSFDAYLDRLKQGAEVGAETDADWRKSTQKALNHPKNAPGIPLLVEIATRLAASCASSSWIITGLPPAVADEFAQAQPPDSPLHVLNPEPGPDDLDRQITRIVTESEASAGKVFVPEKAPGAIDYDSAVNLLQCWTNIIDQEYRQVVREHVRQSLQLIDSAKRYAQGDVDEFVSALNDCADFNNVSARIVANMPNDDIEQVLWDAAEQHCDRLEGILEQSKRPAWAQRIRERHQLVMDGLELGERIYRGRARQWGEECLRAKSGEDATEAAIGCIAHVKGSVASDQAASPGVAALHAEFDAALNSILESAATCQDSLIRERVTLDDEWIRECCATLNDRKARPARPVIPGIPIPK
ncbi:unnamed protein product (mitochondrion) [Plasmodiophora brassicae]|uniref:Calponin-homology (CH) domain-containing protein n=1 Tax=Plasmodiophora brassicae TaxID=37360 RepID=A0A3P3YNR9_PLABS|nr:unnamed protein product [Plasmodiophora brassicae]